MNEKIKTFLKPSAAKIALAIIFLLWQYFYNYVGMNFDFAGQLLDYIAKGLGLVSWNNYFVRTGSLVLIWVLVAFFIFIGIWFFERASIALHNRKIEKNYMNQPKENYQELLKSQKNSFKRHFLSNAIWAGGFLLFITVLFLISGQIENIRFWVLDTFTWNLIENGQEIETNETLTVVISFLAMAPIWYLVSCVHLWVFEEGKVKIEEEEIDSEHVPVVIDLPEEEDEENSRQSLDSK